MLRRKAMEKIEAWKRMKKKKCLLVNGARQVGKTFLVREFGRANYSSFIELNFLEKPSLKTIFDGELDADAVRAGIRLSDPGVKFRDGDTMIFLDEIQECPNAISALKFLAEDPRADIAASGSALGMAYGRVSSYPVGSIDYLDMHALDFEEFLWALGVEEDEIRLLRDYYLRRETVPPAIHLSMQKYLRQYMVIGGMPEVVDTFLPEKDYPAADEVQRRIYRDYLADIARFAAPDVKIKAESCYRSIPLQLSKENHKFQYSVVEKKGTARKFESSLDWLANANMISVVTNVGFVEYPLKAHALENNTRIYPNDIGLLMAAYDYGLKKALLEEETMDGRPGNIVLRTAKGGLYEALIADMLTKAGHRELFFYRNEPGTVEMEFLLENADGVIPVEVKAGKKSSKSLANLLKKEDIPYGYKLASQNIGVSDKMITLPLYMAIFL